MSFTKRYPQFISSEVLALLLWCLVIFTFYVSYPVSFYIVSFSSVTPYIISELFTFLADETSSTTIGSWLISWQNILASVWKNLCFFYPIFVFLTSLFCFNSSLMVTIFCALSSSIFVLDVDIFFVNIFSYFCCCLLQVHRRFRFLLLRLRFLF